MKSFKILCALMLIALCTSLFSTQSSASNYQHQNEDETVMSDCQSVDVSTVENHSFVNFDFVAPLPLRIMDNLVTCQKHIYKASYSTYFASNYTAYRSDDPNK